MPTLPANAYCTNPNLASLDHPLFISFSSVTAHLLPVQYKLNLPATALETEKTTDQNQNSSIACTSSYLKWQTANSL